MILTAISSLFERWEAQVEFSRSTREMGLLSLFHWSVLITGTALISI